MTTITLNGKPLRMHYTMLTAVLYQRITGRNALHLEQFTTGELEPIASLGYALLLSANPQEDVPDYIDMLNAISDGYTLKTFIEAVSAEMKSYFEPADGEQTAATTLEDNEPKNDCPPSTSTKSS